MDLAIQGQNWPVANQVQNPDDQLLTIDDLEAGFPVEYDALVLYAEEDQDFVDELSRRMEGFRLLTRYRENLRLSVMPHNLMCQLITDRCPFIILIYSEAFFESLDEPINEQAVLIAENSAEAGRLHEARRQREARRQNRYYADYVHADKIASKTHKMIPCVYEEVKESNLPEAYRYNFMLYVNSEAYNFYERLAKVLTKGRESRSAGNSGPAITNGHAPSGASRCSRRVSILRRIMRRCRNLARRFNKSQHKILREH